MQVTASGPDNFSNPSTHLIEITVAYITGVFNVVVFSMFLCFQSASKLLHSEDMHTVSISRNIHKQKYTLHVYKHNSKIKRKICLEFFVPLPSYIIFVVTLFALSFIVISHAHFLISILVSHFHFYPCLLVQAPLYLHSSALS